jgi:hypothetical protein
MLIFAGIDRANYADPINPDTGQGRLVPMSAIGTKRTLGSVKKHAHTKSPAVEKQIFAAGDNCRKWVEPRVLLLLALFLQNLLVFLSQAPSGPHAVLQTVRQFIERYNKITLDWPFCQQLRMIAFWIIFLRIDF